MKFKITACNHTHIICHKKNQHGIRGLVLIIALLDRRKDPDSVTGCRTPEEGIDEKFLTVSLTKFAKVDQKELRTKAGSVDPPGSWC